MMKLTIILSIKESHDRVAELLDQAGVKRFSTIDITGYNERQVITPVDASDPAWSPLLP